MSKMEKLLEGTANINDYDLELDFDYNEIETLLDEGVITPRDLNESLASDLIIDEILDYDQYPFENFSPHEQLRQLRYGAISVENFIKKADLDSFNEEEQEWFSNLINNEMGEYFVPANDLEKAIQKKDSPRIMKAVMENNELTSLPPASWLGSEDFSDEIIYSILYLATKKELVEQMNSGFFHIHMGAGPRMKALARDVLTPLPGIPDDGEKELCRAIRCHENEEIIRLIREEGVKLKGFTTVLLTHLPQLSKKAVLTFLRDGLCPKLKPIVLYLLQKETVKRNFLPDFTDEDCIKYTNLMIHLISGENVSADQPWYPEKGGEEFFYYFDPYHRYEPGI